MIYQEFQSQRNKNALIAFIQDSIQNDLKKKNISIHPYQDGIQETMNYVQQNVSDKVPYGVSSEDYLMMMNKKVFSLITPVIKKDVEEKIEKEKNNYTIIPPRRMISMNTQPKEHFKNSSSNRIQPVTSVKQDPTFDPVLLKQYENIPIADYPSPSDQKEKESDMNQRIDQLQMERNEIYPKPSKVHFQDPISDLPKESVHNMFQKRNKDYKNEYEAIPIDHFEENTVEYFKNEQNNQVSGKEVSTREMDTRTYHLNIPEFDRQKILYDQKIDNQKDISTQEGMSFSPFNHEKPQLKSVILPAPIENYEKKYRIMINSLDRNKYLFPYQNDFEIKFNPASSSYRFDAYVDSYGEIIYTGKEIVYSDSSIGATIPITFDNIRQIVLLEVLVPVIGFYAGGRGPVVFNSAVPATGQTTTFEQYNPIATRTTGIPQGVYKEPFLYLIVPELEQNFYSTDNVGNRAFSKLIPEFSSNTGFISVYTSTFTKLYPDGRTDFYRYDPITKGKLDKFTPKICNFRGKEYDFGIDKLIIDKFERSTLRYSGYCGNEYYTTHFFIKKTDASYANYCTRFATYRKDCDTLSSTPLVPGDLLYFYNTLPVEQDIIYFQPNIQVFNFTNIDADTVKINAGYVKDGDTRYLNFQDFIPGGNTNTFEIYNQYYIAFSMNVPGHIGLKTYYFRIVGFQDGDVLVKRTAVFDTYIQISQIAKFGFVKNNPQGIQDDNVKSLFNRNGHYIYRVGTIQNNGQIATENTDQYKISLDFPYEYLTEYFESFASNYTYQSGDFFFVQHKLQLIYEFEITVATKNIEPVRSFIEGSGLNF